MKLKTKALAIAALATVGALGAGAARAQSCSVWLVENSRFMKVPFGAFQPDRAYVQGSTDPHNNINTVDLPVNVGVIKCGKDLILYDSGWNQTEYHKATGTEHWSPLSQQIEQLGFKAGEVSKIVIGHGHWDHAGSLDEFPNATLYVQAEELRGIEWALNYPGHERIRATNLEKGSCSRTPACGYTPKTVDQIYGKVLRGKAVVVDGEHEIMPGVKIHPAHRAHTAGSQLLEVQTSVGKLVFGSDAYSSWEGIRDWEVANIQQTDSVQQFLAYEKCYKITGGYQNCVSGHEPLSYTDKYPLTKNSWVGMNGGRLAEIALEPGEQSRKKPAPAVIRFEEAALFDSDKADLKQEGKEQLNAYREKAQADLSSAEKVRIVGYTDSTGTAEYNSKLSQQRSEAVRDYLVGIGADPKKMEAIGAAGANPIADNGTKEGRAKNRRVEIEVFGLSK